MEKIFYADCSAHENSELAVKRILEKYYDIPNAEIDRNEQGKPFLKNAPLFFSVSHTENKRFIAISRENVGIDAESLQREVAYLPIVKKFDGEERTEIRSRRDFLYHWTAKESAVKWLGGSLAHDLYKLRYIKEKLYYGEIELPVRICFFIRENILICVCSERDFSNAEQITVY